MKKSAGVLVYRVINGLEIFLVHPGGPFFKNKDLGAWTIPKGELNEDEEPLAAARREFFEETGFELAGEFAELGQIKQKAGKIVFAWATEQDIDETKIISNTFQLELPARSKKFVTFPEIDKASWFNIDEAKMKINSAQIELIDRLENLISSR